MPRHHITLTPISPFVFVPGTQRAVLAGLLCVFCFDSLTSPLISHKDAIIDVIKCGVQQNVRAASLNN